MFRNSILLLVISVAFPAFGESLTDISKPIEGRRMRASSAAPGQSNRDYLTIQPGETITLAELDGPGVIQHIWFTVSSGDYRYPAKTILRIYWDDHPEPSVQAPLGDFFAAGHGMRVNVNSEPVQVSAEGRAYNCYWSMPFRRKARLVLENQSDKRMGAFYYYIDWLKLDKPKDDASEGVNVDEPDDWLKLDKPKDDAYYFHAQYRQERPHDTSHDYTILETTGRGNYVGTVLSSHCGYHAWFGEGDDRVYIDGESQPSLRGTGTEDYFNDAWGFREFCHPDAGCTIFEGRSIDSRATAYRWHVRDPIPFEKSIRFTIENKGWIAYENGKHYTNCGDRRDNYSSVAFWYQDRPAVKVPPLPALAERLDPELYFGINQLLDMAQVGGRAQAELEFVRRIMPRSFFHLKASQPDAEVSFPIKIDAKGRYSVSLWKVGMPDGGIYEARLDGKVIAGHLDFYEEGEIIEEEGRIMPLRESHERKLGLFYLNPGEHELKFKCVGRNPQSHLPDSREPGYGLGLHGLSLRKISFENMDQYLTDPLPSPERPRE